MPVWLSYPARPGTAAATPSGLKHVLVFFLPGNPGFVDYYQPFLQTLRARLDEVEDQAGSRVRFDIVGRNLLGFDDGDDGASEVGGVGKMATVSSSSRYGARPYDLDTQIRAAGDAIAAAAARGPEQGVDSGRRPFDQVILMGHSVGSYIALEVFRRQTATTAGLTGPPLRLGIFLFATLAHLARSSHGGQLSRLLATPLLGPHVPRLANALARLLFAWPPWPAWAVNGLVRGVTGFPAAAAAVTARFLASQGGVQQALFLGGDELQHIAEDRWEAVEAEAKPESQEARPRYVIFFGKDDHWVDNACRDEFVARRQQGPDRDRVRIITDDSGLPHAFCIQHGEEVAEKVKTWIAEETESW